MKLHIPQSTLIAGSLALLLGLGALATTSFAFTQRNKARKALAALEEEQQRHEATRQRTRKLEGMLAKAKQQQKAIAAKVSKVRGAVQAVKEARENGEGPDEGRRAAMREELRAKAVERRMSKVSQRTDAAVRRFAEAEGLDARTEEEMRTLVDEFFASFVELGGQMKQGELSGPEAREELQAVREDIQADLVEVLGPETAGRLRERLLQRRGKR